MAYEGPSSGPDSAYPVTFLMPCTVLSRNSQNVTVSTAEPAGVETEDGVHVFVVATDRVEAINS